MFTRRFFISASTAFIASPVFAQSEAPPPVKVALVVQRPGEDYFNACRQGVLEAAAEVDGVQVTYASPATADAALQAKLVDDLVGQGYGVIVIAPIASDVVIAACARAVQAGRKVISIGVPLPPDARHLHLSTPDVALAAPGLLQIINTALGKTGEVALLSSSSDSAEHLAVVKALQKEWLKPDYAELALITTVFGGGDVQRNYAEALAVMQAYPNLRGIIAPQLGGTAGAARAVMDLGRSNVVKVTGVGLPSRLAPAVQSGVIPAFVTWNPVDVGYAAARIGIALAKNEAVIQANAPVLAGRLGQLPVDDSGTAQVGEMITVDPASLDKYADLF